MYTIRAYHPSDEPQWLECRLLGFFGTNYYDDVKTAKTVLPDPQLCFVAEDGGRVLGLIDVEVDGQGATIDSIAVRPDAQRRGIAGALLRHATERLPAGVRTLDAWTREDAGANAWYRSSGFLENHRYLHVYKNWDEPNDGYASPHGLSAPVMAFMHADIEHEAALRERHARVYICRQYLKQL
ncbi:GNAT family N-acetyltransferase [Paeniglutamicibacter sp. R2-26]|uniref:GNAT family N-acetyltransferase n=1 Tax=Paeniglutamicibacter sp. R2-26 TaxID=3144417 RepID=UPI003EE6CD95